MTTARGLCIYFDYKIINHMVTSILVTPPEKIRVKRFPSDNLIFMTSFF